MKEYSVILRNRITQRLKCEIVKAPSIGDAKKEALIKNVKHECMHVKENNKKIGAKRS